MEINEDTNHEDSSPRKKVVCHKHKDLRSCAMHTLKGTLLGFFLMVIPLSIRSRKLEGTRKGAALAILLGYFRFLDCLIWSLKEAKLITNDRLKTLIDRYSIAICALISSSLYLSVDTSFRNASMIVYLWVRAIRPFVPSIPFGPVIVMAVSSAHILSTWIRAPEELSPSYRAFLNFHGGKGYDNLKFYRQNYPQQDYACTFSHPGVSCHLHAVIFFLEGLRRAAPVYIPFHLLSYYLSSKRSISDTLYNFAMSCSFLSSYCTVAWASACVFFRIWPGVNRHKLFMCCWVPGFALLLERKGRQKELASYCLTQSLVSLYNYFQKKGVVKPVDWMANVLLVLGFSVVMHKHQEQPSFVTRGLFGLNYKYLS